MLAIHALLVGCAGDAPPPPPPVVAPPPEPVVEAVEEEEAPANRLPRVLAVRFKPGEPTVRDEIRVEVKAEDPDGDPVDVDLRWKVNDDVLLHRTAEVLPPGETKKGDQVRVIVTASDGTDTVERESDPVEVVNSAPFFESDPRGVSRLDGYVVEASDPDDEPVTFSLQGGPRGMTVDERSGRISYEGSADEPGGAYQVRVIARDADGATASWQFGLTVTPGSKAAGKP